MIFKKKYKRREWFEGLLECEELIKSGFEFKEAEDYMWFTKQHSSFGIPKHATLRCQGIEDYINYFNEKLK